MYKFVFQRFIQPGLPKIVPSIFLFPLAHLRLHEKELKFNPGLLLPDLEFFREKKRNVSDC